MSSSATVRVEKATSDLLIGPDWTLNMDICDSVNSNHWEAKDVVKAVKKRLQHKNPMVQFLALTLLETMVKNCGDYVHFQIAERNILPEMIKIVKKKADMRVRDKILMLLDSWQEAFGGPGGKHPQYYWAYVELRRSGVVFPRRSSDTAPIFTPPATHPTPGQLQLGYGMPSNIPRRLDEAMASEVETLSPSSLKSMHNIMDLLADMLQAVNPSDREALQDEVIVDLVSRCRTNQKKLIQMLTSTVDEELLGQGLELNDSLQNLLAKHDAMASGSPLPTQPSSSGSCIAEVNESRVKSNEFSNASPRPNTNITSPVTAVPKSPLEEEEDEEDDFAQLARSSATLFNTSNVAASSISTDYNPTSNNTLALALPDPPAPVRTTKEQDMIDLLSITLTTSSSPHSPVPPSSASSQNMNQVPVSPTSQVCPNNTQPQQAQYFGGQGMQVRYNSYVAPWAQPQPQTQPAQAQAQPQPQPQPPPQSQSQSQSQPQPQAQAQPQPQQPSQPQYSQYMPSYPPPPWAPTPGYYSNPNPVSGAAFYSPTAQATGAYTSLQVSRALQHYNSFPARNANGSAVQGDTQTNFGSYNAPGATGQKPFIPSYRLFEDLNVLGSATADAKLNITSSTSPSLSGTSGQSMVGGRK
ncbi:VHS domain [Dillenia turbinata]|uniref:VHS domain n=1 Tax=Dillenia turbinata TaxID=194707 RepID=A0AAN8ZQN9_9MAGN